MAQENELKLQKVNFTKALRGYSCEEVDTYTAYVNDRYNALVREYLEIRRKMTVMAAGQNEFREDALREKDKIAAEAEAIVKEKKAEADKLVEDAMRKAARILSEAETAAAGILKRAEAEAETMLDSNRATEEARAEAERKLAEQNTAAERLVEEIDSFREEVFAMYGRHIEELERLARRTDRFYQDKETLTEGLLPETEVDEPMAVAASEYTGEDAGETYMTAAEAEETLVEEETVWEDPDGETELSEDEEDFLRIDWKKHRAGRDAAETEEDDGEWELPTETDTEEDSVWEDPAADSFYAEEEAGSAAEAQTEESLLSEDFEDPAELLAEAEEEETPAAQLSEEDFLSGIASEYFAPQQAAARPAAKAKPAPQQKKAVREGNLDDLFYDEDSKHVSLTGEFDKIFSSKNSAANVAEIDRQPLVGAKKPEKPKKHGNGNKG